MRLITSFLYCPSCFLRLWLVTPACLDYLLFLSLPESPAYPSCLATGCTTFCYTNDSNLSTHNIQISYNNSVNPGGQSEDLDYSCH